MRVIGWLFAAAVLVIFFFMAFGSALLTAVRPPTEHVDAAIVLQGSLVGEKVRTAGAMKMLQEGTADRVVLSVPHESYWGQSIPAVARPYLERVFGPALAARVDFCETGEQVNSTLEEAKSILPCIREHRWQNIAVVTSNYHTRRASLIWKKLVQPDASLRLWIIGVDDPEFRQPWWRHRQSAKILLMEFTKLAWMSLGGERVF